MTRHDNNPACPQTPVVEILDTLIGLPTVSADSNLALIDYIEGYLAEFDVPSTRFMNPEGTKANLFATIGDSEAPGVILSGHTDVVPVTGQDWSNDPFRMRQQDGRLYGRGTADMKGFIAVVLAAVPRMLAADMDAPIHLAFSYDEEVGCTGCRSMVAAVAELKPRPKLCIVGEPTEMKVVNAHKGKRNFETTVTGAPAHSSQPAAGANAIFAAARLISWIDTEQTARREAPVSDDAARFNPPYTTLNVGVVSGGVTLNIVAEHARFIWEYRSLPEDDDSVIIDAFNNHATTEVLPALKAVTDRASIETREIGRVPQLKADPDCWAERFVLSLTKSNTVGAASYATEAGHFRNTAQVPTIVCGPGSIDQAHKADEWIALSELKAAEDFIVALIAALGRASQA